MKKRIICLVLSVILSLSLIACSSGTTTTPPSAANTGGSPAASPPGSSPPAASPPGNSPSTTYSPPPLAPPSPDKNYVEKLVFVTSERPTIFDTCAVGGYSAPCEWGYIMVYNQLIKYTPDFEFKPALATSWETSDYKHFTFHLREGVFFHNGEPFTADDVAFTIDRAKQSVGSRAYDRMKMIESYNIINDHEIELVLQDVNVDFYANISFQYCGILNRKAVEGDPEKGTWIGTGPWTVSEFVADDRIVLTVNENYWGEKPVTKTFVLRCVAEETARILMLENGECHVVNAPAPANLPAIAANPDLDYFGFALNNTTFLGFNLLQPFMSDINFRMAVAHAINRDDCVNITRDGYAYPVDSGTFWGYKTEFKNTDIPIIPYDLNKAKEYLAKTDYKGEEIEIVGSNPLLLKNAQIFQENLKEIGINTSIKEVDAPTMASYGAWGNTNTMLLSSSGEWQQMASACRNYLYPGAVMNRANYNNPEVAALLDEALTTLDAAKREIIYRRVQELVAQDIPYLGIFNIEFHMAHTKGLGGIVAYPNLAVDFTYTYLEKK